MGSKSPGPGILRPPSGLDGHVPKPVQDYITEIYNALTGISGQVNSLQSTKKTLISATVPDPLTPLTPSLISAIIGPGSSGLAITGTHAIRLSTYPASSYQVGTIFYETDRMVEYVISNSTGTNQWVYAAGMFATTFAGRPTDLGANDAGFLLWITVQNHVFRWSGAAWAFTDSGSGYITGFVAAPPGTGWQLCDGTATDYVVISGADLALTAFTTPDEITTPGVFHKSAAAYTGAINAASAPGISGSVGNITATNNATGTGITANLAATNVTVTQHTVAQNVAVGVATWSFPLQADAAHAVNDPTHTHTISDPGHNHTQNAHNHGVGSLAVDATGLPRNLALIPYFRR